MFNKILFPTDGSEFSQKAASLAATIAGKFDASVTILHIISKSGRSARFDVSAGVSGGTATGELSAVVLPAPSEEETREEKIGQTILGQTKQVFQKTGVHAETMLGHGEPEKVICQIADEEKFDLIVMNSKGTGKMKLFLMGSISYHVSRNAHCPVMIVR